MMLLINYLRLSAVMLVSSFTQADNKSFDIKSYFQRNGVFDLEKCLAKHGGSGALGPLCYIEKSKEYESNTNKIDNDLMKKVPNASKKLLTSYRQNFKNNLVMCELHFQAYNNWEKPDNQPTLADIERAQCIFEMRKEEYQYYSKLLCLPNYSCPD